MTEDRKKLIISCKDYITFYNTIHLYGMNKHYVIVRKDIPIELTDEDLIMFTDNWNGCFGGRVKKYDKDAYHWEYEVFVYTD